jgi:hypothetical protein
MSVTKTRSLDNILNFKESGKSLTMDSLPFSEFSPLSLKKYKIDRGELSRRDESLEVYLFPP